MNILMLCLGVLLSFPAFARQSISLTPINFQVNSTHVLSKFEEAVLNPEGILRRYKPTGVRATNKRVAGNEISFVATKTVLVISKSVYIHGILESRDAGNGCYNLNMRFETSDRLVTDNVEQLQARICVKEDSNSKLSGQVRAQILTGNRYSRTLGPMAVNLIKDQVSPILNALTEEIKAMR